METPRMKLSHSLKATLLAASLLANGAFTSVAYAAEYSFRVHNSTDTRITKILVSENRRTWGAFDVGRGIKAGDDAKLVWDKSTNNQECEQWVKAVFADGSETKPAKFDFCEKRLEIEF
jgi:hypothetical protein